MGPEACPVQEGCVYGRWNGDGSVEHLAEQGERGEQRESGQQCLDPPAGASEDQKCQGRVRVWLLQRHIQRHDHQEAGARHISGSSFNGEQREHAEHTVGVAARGEEEKQGSAWKAEECSEEGQKHIRGTRVWERERHQLGECAEQAEYEYKMSTASKLIQRARSASKD